MRFGASVAIRLVRAHTLWRARPSESHRASGQVPTSRIAARPDPDSLRCVACRQESHRRACCNSVNGGVDGLPWMSIRSACSRSIGIPIASVRYLANLTNMRNLLFCLADPVHLPSTQHRLRDAGLSVPRDGPHSVPAARITAPVGTRHAAPMSQHQCLNRTPLRSSHPRHRSYASHVLSGRSIEPLLPTTLLPDHPTLGLLC